MKKCTIYIYISTLNDVGRVQHYYLQVCVMNLKLVLDRYGNKESDLVAWQFLKEKKRAQHSPNDFTGKG